MRYFVWLAMIICSGCAAPTADEVQNPVPQVDPDVVVQDPAPQDPTTVELTSTELDLVALDTTFLNAANAASRELGQPAVHHFVDLSDPNGLLWQGEAFGNSEKWIVLLQPMQNGGEAAIRFDISNGTETLDALMPPISEALPAVKQTAATPDAVLTFVRATLSGDTWSFAVSVDHPDTGWEDYTDGWHVETPAGEILTTRILAHPHVGERPFTRSSSGFAIPDGVTEVHVRAHDLISGYGTETVTVPIAEAGSDDRYEVFR